MRPWSAAELSIRLTTLALPPHEGTRSNEGANQRERCSCATGACPETFSRQWSALTSDHTGPIALLALHTALQRTQSEFGGGPGWVTNAIAYLDQTLPANGAKTISFDRLWVVVEGSAGEEAIARKTAVKANVAAVIVARTKIDQSYEPRMVSTK